VVYFSGDHSLETPASAKNLAYVYAAIHNARITSYSSLKLSTVVNQKQFYYMIYTTLLPKKKYTKYFTCLLFVCLLPVDVDVAEILYRLRRDTQAS